MSRKQHDSSVAAERTLLSDAFLAIQEDKAYIRDAEQTSGRRERLLPALLVHIETERRAKTQRGRWRAAGGTALAASLLLGVGFGLQSNWFQGRQALGAELLVTAAEGSYEITGPDGQRRASVSGASSLAAGSSLQVGAQSSASVSTPNGVVARVDESSALEVLQLDPYSYESLRLIQGRVDVKVPPLEPGRRFAVVTAQATIIVHGTDFTVDLKGGDKEGRPCVQVREGLVEVRTASRAAFLGANASWSCGEQPADPLTGRATAEADVGSDDAPQVTQTRIQRRRGAENVDTLSVQNQLFRRGLLNKQNGNWQLAESDLTQLLRLYPESPFAAEALVQLADIRSRAK